MRTIRVATAADVAIPLFTSPNRIFLRETCFYMNRRPSMQKFIKKDESTVMDTIFPPTIFASPNLNVR
jgi:hypothetical protein